MSGGKRGRKKTDNPLQGNYLSKVITESLSKAGLASSEKEGQDASTGNGSSMEFWRSW